MLAADATRPWISKEKNQMLRLLQQAAIPHTEHLYLQGQELTLLMHFLVIEELQRNRSQHRTVQSSRNRNDPLV